MRAAVAAILSSLVMGYVARLTFGCNLGAFFSCAASFSVHGWLWIVCVLRNALERRPAPALFGLRKWAAPPQRKGFGRCTRSDPTAALVDAAYVFAQDV